MKGRIKKTISLTLLSAATALSIFGLAGCSNNRKGDSQYSFVTDSDVYLIYNGTLHKGDLYYVGSSWHSIQATMPSFDTDCGMSRSTMDVIVSPNEIPQSDEYEHICEECFPENE